MKIGDRFSEIGDPCSGVGHCGYGLPDIAWCKVPAGRITLEKEVGTFEVGSFTIAKYPVTWIQYRSFVDAKDGYQNKSWWEKLDEREYEPFGQYRKLDNHPAENVSWYDAMAFCRWLTTRLDCEVRLPTECEWQQAVTGGDSTNKYPWGPIWDSDRANTFESGLTRTTAVGLYPKGASPVRVLDMCGNVWEWCLNENDGPLKVKLPDDGRRVVRGGSWNDSPSLAHCANRILSSPDHRKAFIGFRLCCVSPIL